MESPQVENPNQTPEERRLSEEILGKVDELLTNDGREITLFQSVGPSKIAKYGFILSNEKIGGERAIPKGSLASEIACELTLNRTPADGEDQETIVLIRVFKKGSQGLSFKLSFLDGSPAFFQYHERPKREATREDLEDFMDILEKPLYLIDC